MHKSGAFGLRFFCPGFFLINRVAAFASRLAPTGVTHSKCGSEPAREDGVAVGASLESVLPAQVQKRIKNPLDLYPVHHLIS
ncbi:hypothetical protein EGJ53_20180 [Pseudomonas fluorescens]|nr:hypothetical protein EGJ53_20180 [Pseudomonas fluorescens]